MIFRVKRRPFSPLGEKVADRPDEGEIVTGNVRKMPLTPALSPNFLGECCHVKPCRIRKKLGERGDMALANQAVSGHSHRLTRGGQAGVSLPEFGREQIAPHD
jgi:hypothetical protein